MDKPLLTAFALAQKLRGRAAELGRIVDALYDEADDIVMETGVLEIAARCSKEELLDIIENVPQLCFKTDLRCVLWSRFPNTIPSLYKHQKK